MRLEISTPATSDPASFALSPDGKRLVFVASGDGQPRLWLRPLDAVTAQPLAGTEGAAHPFWFDRQQYDVAPNGRFLINVTTEDATTAPVTLLLNWKPPAK